MNTDYTVILESIEQFTGTPKSFSFKCPLINMNQPAILFINSLGLDVRQRVYINGNRLSDYLNVSGDYTIGNITANSSISGNNVITNVNPEYISVDKWVTSTLIIPAKKLKIENQLKIYATDDDSFIVDNIFILFKTVKDTSLPPPPNPPIGY